MRQRLLICFPSGFRWLVKFNFFIIAHHCYSVCVYTCVSLLSIKQQLVIVFVTLRPYFNYKVGRLYLMRCSSGINQCFGQFHGRV